jgi:hypothetical protein
MYRWFVHRWAISLAILAGCGRAHFDLRTAPPDPDATTPGDAMRGCADIPGVLFCDGLDTPGFPAWDAGSIGVALRETTIVHAGASSFHASSPSPSEPVDLEVAPYDHLTTGGVHYRAWFYLPSTVAITKFNLYGTDGDTAASGVVFLDDHDELRAYDPTGAITLTSGIATPRDRWFCVEIHVALATAATGSISFDLDGSEIGERSGIATSPPGGFTRLAVGLPFLDPAQGAVDLYVDDVATGTQPIGCN